MKMRFHGTCCGSGRVLRGVCGWGVKGGCARGKQSEAKSNWKKTHMAWPRWTPGISVLEKIDVHEKKKTNTFIKLQTRFLHQFRGTSET